MPHDSLTFRFRPALMAALALMGCAQGGTLTSVPIPRLDLVVDSPVYGQFAGPGDLRVAGSTGSGRSIVLVEGVPVEVDAEGRFETFVPYDRAWRIIDIEASLYEDAASVRIPTFAGLDPAESWPGALPLRLTPAGLDALGGLLGGLVDGFLTEEAITGLIPPVQQDGFSFRVTGFSASPAQVALTPRATDLEASFLLSDILLELDLTFNGLLGNPNTVPVGLGIEEAGLTLPIALQVDAAGAPVIAPGEGEVELSPPEIAFGQADLSFLTGLLGNNLDLGQLITDALLGAVQGQGPISLGAPIAFETDLLGTQLALRLDDLVTDPGGVGILLGLGLGGPVPDDLSRIPFPVGAGEPPPDLAVGLHDGLLTLLLQSDLLDLLEQDIVLPGFPGEFIGNLVRGLPGGTQAPLETGGWCLKLDPGGARLARFAKGEGPLVGVYLPDAVLDFGYLPVGQSAAPCTPWLSASVALEVGLGLDGTELDLSIAAPEGSLLAYGADGYDDPVNAQRVVDDLSARLSGLLGLLGGLGGDFLDLGSLLGGLGDGLDGLEIAIRGTRQAVDVNGVPIEGMAEVGIGLFGSAEPAQ